MAGAEVTARGGSNQNKEVSSGTASRAKCYVCRKMGHRASECRSKDVGIQKGEVKMDRGRGRIVYTCYVCGNEGYRSFECPNKKPVKKEKEPQGSCKYCRCSTWPSSYGWSH